MHDTGAPGGRLDMLCRQAAKCTLCAADLPHRPRPVFQVSETARILIAGQAPGSRVHASGVPFDDASGDRLRDWMGIDREPFYDPDRVAILPMSFCYPGRGRSGDLPPRAECAPAWRQCFLDAMPAIALTVILGAYAMRWHLGNEQHRTLTDAIRASGATDAGTIALPHPSPRNRPWLSRNPWFESEIVPVLKSRVASALDA